MTAVAVLFTTLGCSFFGPIGACVRQKAAAIVMQVTRVFLYPIPYIAVLTGVWPEFGSVASIAIYTAFFLR